MIQAPQVQYMPAQQNLQPAIPQYQNGVNMMNSYATQTPGVIYNYPTTSCYGQPTAKEQFNGVNIEILNPQGQGMPLGQPTYQMPATFVPQIQTPVIPQYPVAEVPAAQPAAQAVVTPQVPQAQITTDAPVNTAAPEVQAAAPEIKPAEQNIDASQTPESFAGKLRTDDVDAQKAAIEEIAGAVKNDPTLGPVLLDTVIFDALSEIIDKDTSALEGPSPEVVELRQKPQEELSEEDKQKAYTPSPLEKAELNKQYALYTMSYMQSLLNSELAKNDKSIELKDVPCIEKVIDTVKSNPNPMLRASGIEALSYIAKPEYKNDLTTIFELAKADEDENVKQTATKAIEALNK